MHFKKILLLLCGILPFVVMASELNIYYQDQHWKLTRDALLAIKPSSMTTQSPWDDSPSEFQGVYLKDLLEHLDIGANNLTAKALNDYEEKFRVSDAVSKKAFIAVLRDGKPMPIRNKGPYWIIFPWQELETDSEVNTNRTFNTWSVWQLSSISLTD